MQFIDHYNFLPETKLPKKSPTTTQWLETGYFQALRSIRIGYQQFQPQNEINCIEDGVQIVGAVVKQFGRHSSLLAISIPINPLFT